LKVLAFNKKKIYFEEEVFMQKRKLFKTLVSALIVLSFIVVMLSGCGQSAGTTQTQTSGQSQASSQASSSAQVTPAASEAKIVWYVPAPHPFFEEQKKGVEQFQKETSIQVQEQVGPDWKQPSETSSVEALAAKGYKYFSIYPSDASGANSLYDELTKQGVTFINVGASSLQPTSAAFCVATDVKTAAMVATENLIKLMGGKGNLINVLEVLNDPNTVLRKQGIEEVVKKYPDIKIIQEISGMSSQEEAVQKVGDALTANINKVDGIIATGMTTSVAVAQVLTDYKTKGGNRTIHSIGIDTDPVVVKAIKAGVMDATISQNPIGQGYLSCSIFKLMSEGYTKKAGTYMIDSGIALVTKDNLDTFSSDIQKVTDQIKADLTTKYLEKK
jgi:ribose transport system substrate-binding protein